MSGKGCPDHPTVVRSQKLSLRIGELTLFKLDQIEREAKSAAMAAHVAADAAAAAATLAQKAAEASIKAAWPWPQVATGSASALGIVALVVGTIWKAMGWWK